MHSDNKTKRIKTKAKANNDGWIWTCFLWIKINSKWDKFQYLLLSHVIYVILIDFITLLMAIWIHGIITTFPCTFVDITEINVRHINKNGHTNSNIMGLHILKKILKVCDSSYHKFYEKSSQVNSNNCVKEKKLHTIFFLYLLCFTWVIPSKKDNIRNKYWTIPGL